MGRVITLVLVLRFLLENRVAFPFRSQIENRLGGEAEFKERLSSHLAPCLAQFAVAAGSDAQWKPLNYQVLLKTRHSSAMVRSTCAESNLFQGIVFHSNLLNFLKYL